MQTVKKILLVLFLSLFILFFPDLKVKGQDTLAYYNFDNGDASIFTTGATGIGLTLDDRCSWELGSPSGGRGYNNLRGQRGYVGNPDPTSDYTTDNTANLVFGQGLSESSKIQGVSGYYNSSSEWFQLPVLDFSNYYNIKLSFWQWGNFEPGYDFAFVEISLDGTNWNKVYNPTTLESTSWENISLNLSNYANNQSQVYIRWRTESDRSIFYSGWNIDNVIITGDFSNNDGDSYIYNGNIIPPENISSLTDSYTERASVLQFKITDAGSGDNLPTIIDTLVITQNELNTIPNWRKAISGISIYDLQNSTELIGSVEKERLIFVNPAMFTINDGTSKTFTLRIYLGKDLSNISDNDRFGMTLNYADFSMNMNGSLIGSGTLSTNSDQLRIDIDATKLNFLTDPEQLVSANRVLTPYVQVAATDENGNIDTDFNGSVLLSNTLNLATLNDSIVADSGIASFNTYFFTETGGPTMLKANDHLNALNNATSQVSVTISESAADVIFEDNFDNSGVTGWTTGAITGSSSWETGEPNGGRGYSNIRFQRGYVGNPDPTADYSSNSVNYVYGQGLSISSKTEGISGYYNNSNEWLMSPAINCTDYYNTQLSFSRWTNTEPDYDKAYLEISTDGIQWIDLGHELYPQDQAWTNLSFDISFYADRQKTVYIRWRLESDESIFYAGWNIDDVSVTGIHSPVTTWTGTYSNNWSDYQNWSTNTIPHNFTSVIIEANTPYNPVVSTQNAICKEVSIRENAVLEINLRGKLEVFGDITIETNATGYGSLHDKGNIVIHGKGIMSRYLSGGMWHYVSSPIKNINTKIFGTKTYKYNEPLASNDWLKGWEQVSNETMGAGIGYDVKRNTDSEVRMEGEFNTGMVIIDLSNTDGSEIPEHEGWNLVGNPYPSAIDWESPTGWTRNNISNAIYIWDKEQQNFITYVGGVGANGGSRYIPPMQGFFVKVINPGSAQLIMNNDVRNSTTLNNLKAAALKNELTFKLSSDGAYSDETVVGLKHNATTEYDITMDADKKFSSNTSVPQLYSFGTKTNPLAINMLPLNNEYYQVKLYTSVPHEGNYMISVDGIIEFDYSKTVYLEDLELDTLIDLTNTQEYNFFSTVVSDSGRFLLHINMPLTITYNVKNVSVGSTDDGAIDVTILGGVQPVLNIEWSNGSKSEDLSGLHAGKYTLTVKDYKSNQVSSTVTVKQTTTDGSLVAINENNKNQAIQIYSNHKTIFIKLNSEKRVHKSQIFDINGKLIYDNQNVYFEDYEIPFNIQNGIYFIRIYGEARSYIEQVLF